MVLARIQAIIQLNQKKKNSHYATKNKGNMEINYPDCLSHWLNCLIEYETLLDLPMAKD